MSSAANHLMQNQMPGHAAKKVQANEFNDF
jgi:hypothetical protein